MVQHLDIHNATGLNNSADQLDILIIYMENPFDTLFLKS